MFTACSSRDLRMLDAKGPRAWPFRRKRGIQMAPAMRALAIILVVQTSASSHVTYIRQQEGDFAVDLCVPPDGIPARQPVEFFVRIRETQPAGSQALGESRQIDTGGPGVMCSLVSGRVAMPSMPTMPFIVPKVRWLGYPGSYGLKLTFPHGGFYHVSLSFTPSSEAKPLSATYLIEVLDEHIDRTALLKPFRLKVKSDPARLSAGKPLRLSLSVLSSETGQPVTDFDIVHEKKLHLILVRDDLGVFFHEHPEPQADRTFTQTFTFPTAGRWSLFAEMAPQGSGSQVALCSLVVSGTPPKPEALVPVTQPTVVRDGLTLAMQPAYLVARRTLWLNFKLRDATGHPPSNLEPWLGAPAHLILVEQDAATFVHSHPDERQEQAVNEGTLIFQVRFPKPGIYKGWVQLQRSGKVSTLPFVVRAVDADN